MFGQQTSHDVHELDNDFDEVEDDVSECLLCSGQLITYTTAPSDYDWFGTTTVAVVGTASNGKTIRKVIGPASRVEAQRDRYASGLHMVADEAEWAKLVAQKLVTVTP
jgi:hypothetical protein